MSDTNLIGMAAQGAGKIFARNLLTASEYIDKGQWQQAIAPAAKDLNRAPDIAYDVKQSYSELKDVYKNIKNMDAKAASSNMSSADIFTKARNFDKAKQIGVLNMADDEIIEWGFFKNTVLQKKLANSKNWKWVLDLDKNMLSTKWGTKLVEKTGGKIIATEAGKKVSGNLASKLLANTLSKICHLNLIFSSLLEIPELKKGFENGDGIRQLGRSGTNIGFSWAAIGLGSAIGRALPTKYKGIASLLCSAIGAGVGIKTGNAVGTTIFGEKSWDTTKSKKGVTYSDSVTYA